ncbi:gephyrin-like molybdotransferase Glp [Bacteroidota bacterium]
MIQLDEALEIALNKAFVLDTERIDYIESLGRILGEDIRSDINMPPFNKSAMDGYACRREDLSFELEVVETIRAGFVPEKSIVERQCASIMTGAILPEGANCVIMVEHTKKSKDNKILFTKEKTKNNICYKGEDIKIGELVLKKGEKIKSQHIAVMASLGCVKPQVYKQPKVGVIATGTELVEPENKPGISQIRNSNGSQMIAQLKALGINPEYYGIAPDSEEKTFNIISDSLKENDVILLSGGVSMGEYDFVPKVLKKLGIELLFQKIAVKPGKPTTFGVNNKKYVFALPGNPVSSFIIFDLLVKPFLYKMMNKDTSQSIIKLPLEKRIERKKAERLVWMPGKINNNGTVQVIDYHGSAHINSLTDADCIISMKAGQLTIESGELADVRQI